MRNRIIVAVLLLTTLTYHPHAQGNRSTIKILAGERWYGSTVVNGSLMPFAAGYEFDMNGDVKGNQAAPLLLSTSGRYIWSHDPFAFKITATDIQISKVKDSLSVMTAGTTLASAFKDASTRFFPSAGKMPDQLLFAQPQYNTWIELVYNQNQDDILKYAHDIINNGFPPGVIMIDDNWAPYYGKFEFRKDRFSDPKKMMDELHALGFKVMIWVCPFISPDSEVFRSLREKKLLLLSAEIKNPNTPQQSQEPVIVNWWNGNSAVMDFTNPEAVAWYSAQLKYMHTQYGVDGFKLDAGDPEFYPAGSVSFKPASQNDHT
ncbi:MAG: glycoside hydrolase, partial [Pedobacter sp.]